jgi:hypothetical protein
MLSSSRWINSTRSRRVYFNIILPSAFHMCPEWLSFSDQNGRQSFYTAVYPRRQLWTSYSPPWELEISQNVKCVLLLPLVPEWPYLGGYLWTGHLIQILSKCIRYRILFFSAGFIFVNTSHHKTFGYPFAAKWNVSVNRLISGSYMINKLATAIRLFLAAIRTA